MKETRISVISDTHLLPEHMVYDNDKFRKDMHLDRKLLAESEGLLNAALDKIHDNKSRLLFVTGDLTKDGEMLSHKHFLGKMLQFLALDSSRRVFLIPGNHDINNRHAYNYNTEGKGEAMPTANVNPIEFMNIYHDLVYKNALSLYKDSDYFKGYLEEVNNSYDRADRHKGYAHGYTSYTSRVDLDETKKGERGLTVIGLDTAKYSIEMVAERMAGCQNTDGIVTLEQLKWLCDQCQEARERKDVIMVLAHHAFLPHFNNQEKSMAPYIIDNSKEILKSDDPRIDGRTPADVLADAGVRFVFTGHMHAQDIAKKTSPNGNVIYDIETGSTVTYPLPVRHLELKNLADTDRLSLDVKTSLIHEFEYTGYANTGHVRIKDALKYSSTDLITAELLEGLIGEYVLPNLKYDSRDFVEIAMGQKSTDYFDFIYKNFLKERFQKEDKILLKKKKTYKIYLSLEERKNNKLPNLIFSIKSLGQKFDYMLKKSDFNEIMDHILDQVDRKILHNHIFLMNWVRDLSDKFLNVKIYDKGSIKTVSDLSNAAYAAHLLGDEKPSKDMLNILDELRGKNMIKKAILQMKKDFGKVLTILLEEVHFSGMIEKKLRRISTNNSFFGNAVDKRVYKLFGYSLSDTLKSLKIKGHDIIAQILEYKQIKDMSSNFSDELLDLVNSLCSEDQKAYKDFAYFEDNNTFIEEKLSGGSIEKADPAKAKDQPSKALLYADIVTIGALLIMFINTNRW